MTPPTTSSGYNWESLAATLSADALAVTAVVWPNSPLPAAVTSAIVAAAGLLTAAHVHVPRVLAKIGAQAAQPAVSGDAADLAEAVTAVLKERGHVAS